ncbi:MAG: YebC/PmpR family DNA-binding transcriptional regulator [Tissierellia bacterium]|nr:YebC/PmpR family DNA-binding transcriptional regulator [Tissierellia bacterium]
MSGHNKWSSIKNKKGKEDAKRGKVFTKLSRAIIVAVREGGEDPEYNPSLKSAIEKAKAENMPNDNIERAIKKGSGDSEQGAYEEVLYEGYGPEGVALMVSCLTDNRNRTASEVRHAFDKFGGNLGQDGSVAFMFERKGVLTVSLEGKDEDEVTLDALDAGADDFEVEDDVAVIKTSLSNFSKVRDDLLGREYNFETADLFYLPLNTTKITKEENIKNMMKIIDMLEDNDDVQDVYHNWEMPEED